MGSSLPLMCHEGSPVSLQPAIYYQANAVCQILNFKGAIYPNHMCIPFAPMLKRISPDQNFNLDYPPSASALLLPSPNF